MKSGATKVIGFTTEPLDGKFKTVRNAESNLGNFVCDLWKDWTGVDCVVLNSGSLRRSAQRQAAVQLACKPGLASWRARPRPALPSLF